MSCSQADRLLQSITVEAPGATKDLIELQLFNVMDEFYKRTNTWRHVQDIMLDQDTFDYQADVPNGAAVVRLLAVEHQGVPVMSKSQMSTVTQSSVGTMVPELTFPDGDSSYLPAESDLSGSNIFTYAIYRPEYLSVTSTLDEEGRKYPLIAVWALSLGKECLECDCGDWDAMPEWHWDQFFQDWLDGSLSRLTGMLGKPWSNPVKAQYHGRRFRNAMGFRKQEAGRGYTYGVPGFRFPRGWV